MKKTLCLTLLAASLVAQGQREKTTFQTAERWKPTTDLRADAVMVYGTRSGGGATFSERVQSWRERGYTTHYMTGIAWGGYADYFIGLWDGRRHMDEGQKAASGDTIMHGRQTPYIVPTKNFLQYFKERQIRPAIEAGIDAIFLEEPEFWARAGYSEAFKREWQEYYGFPWRPPHESAENTYLANKLKYHLYYRALDEAFSYAKALGAERGMKVRCYVPTHSLLNYTMWGIVSPEASLASMQSCDGYIAQVWTGTSRAQNYFNGVRRERVFETAFLEYGCMESMVRPTERKVFFLTDPIEDRAVDWEDYRRNYQATFAAQLLYPSVADYEVMPWPDRIYERLYRVSSQSDSMARIPRFYSTQMQVMINALGRMPVSHSRVSGPQGVSVLMANSLMFQQPIRGQNYSDPHLSDFFGLAMPLLKRGIPVEIMHLENVAYPQTWAGQKVLLMTYSNMKPLSPAAHSHIAEWVRQGGHLIYCGRDDDAYQAVSEWWNQQGNHYAAPSEHLFALLGIPARASGRYTVGRGTVSIIRQDPKEFVMKPQADAPLVECVRQAYGPWQEKNHLQLSRPPYVIAAVMDEAASDEPLRLQGSYVDLFDPALPCLTEKVVRPGEQAFLFDLQAVGRKQPQVVAAASRQYDEQRTRHSYSFTAKSPAETDNAMRILLPRAPKQVCVSVPSQWEWDAPTHTMLLRFENQPDGVRVEISF